ncbi:MAG: cation:proton antiporter [Ardenticatenaceae bacterium]|nr:MAG: cation:proton antiporter [Ardenticatenaceae bacterium]
MEIVMALIVGTLYAAGVYMIRRRSLVKLIIGLALIGYASNMLIFSTGQLVRGKPPLVHEGVDFASFADPLPQALILTAIVIGFGAQAFAIVLLRRVYQRIGTDDIDKLISTDK